MISFWFFFFFMVRGPTRSKTLYSSAAAEGDKRQEMRDRNAPLREQARGLKGLDPANPMHPAEDIERELEMAREVRLEVTSVCQRLFGLKPQRTGNGKGASA